MDNQKGKFEELTHKIGMWKTASCVTKQEENISLQINQIKHLLTKHIKGHKAILKFFTASLISSELFSVFMDPKKDSSTRQNPRTFVDHYKFS